MSRDYAEYMDILGFPEEHSWGKAVFADPILPKELPLTKPKLFFVCDSLNFGSQEAGALLLKKMIVAMGLAFDAVLVLELDPEDLAGSKELIVEKVRELQPLLLLCLGELATQTFVSQNESLEALRGPFHKAGFPEVGRPPAVAVSYHPQALLDRLDLKKKAWEDLQAVMAVL